ncbi:MAG: tetratricopeptide repeat protein [Cyanobacteria bacterium J06634_6]
MPAPTLLNNRYRILKALGEGSFNRTYLAEDTHPGNGARRVIKQLKASNVKTDPPSQDRFLREAATLKAMSENHGQLSHLSDYFVNQGWFYIAQSWIDGTPLSELVTAPWPEAKVTQLLISVMQPLAYLHHQQIIHPDLGPDNIIITKNAQLPCLTNFGTVETLIKNAQLTASKSAIGKPMTKTQGFMAPEQAMGRAVPSSNLYSAGMIAIHLLTARSPLKIPTDPNNGRLLWKPLAPTVSDRLAGILTRAIHNNPAIRFANAAEMLEILTQSAAVAIPRAAQKVADPAAVQNLANEPTQVAKSHTQINTAETAVARSNTAMQPPAVSRPQTGATVAVSAAAPVSTPPQNQYYSPSAGASSSGSSGNSSGGLFNSSLFKKSGLVLGASGIAATLFFVLSNLSGGTVSTFEASSSEQLEDAIATLEEQVENQPDNADLNLQLAESYTHAGDVEAADRYIAAVLDEDGSNSDALYQQGRLYFHISDYEQAISTLEDALEEDNKNGPAMIMLGRAYQEIGEYNQAKEQFEEALSIRGQKGEAHLNLSYLQNLQGDVRAALKSADKAARSFSGDDMLRIHAQRGTLYFDLKDLEKAEENWQAAAELSPRNPEAYVVQSISKFFLGDSEGAISNLEEATDINPNFAEAYAMQSLIYLNQAELDPSVAAIEQALDLDDNSITVLKITADVTLAQAEPDPELSYTASSKALDINPNNPYILNQRCSLLSIVRELDAAVEDCSRSLEVNPSGIEAYTLRGQTYIAMGDFERAEADFTRIIEINEEVGRPQDPEAYAQRAVARTGLEDIEGAEADLQAAFELNGQEPIDFEQLQRDLEGELGEQLKEGLEELDIDLEQLERELEIEIEQNR